MSIETQRANLAKLQAKIAEGSAKIKAIDVDLKQEVREARISDMRVEILKGVADIVADMEQRRATSSDGLAYWSQDAARRRAKFNDKPDIDAAQRLAAFETLRRVPTAGLADYLADAVTANNLALAETVRLEYSSRTDALRDPIAGARFNSLFAKVIDAKARDMHAELSQMIGVADVARTVIREFEAGGQVSAALIADRMSAFRAAGMTVVVEPTDPAKRAAEMRAA